MRAQMKYADKRGASAVVIEGEDERAAGTLTVKDLALGRELAHDISDRETWRSERPAQQSVARGAIVPTLKTILKASA
jgi:histidyl-tRNA synthetase